MIAEVALSKKLGRLRDQVCRTTKFSAANILILYIGCPLGKKMLLTQYRLWIESAWRLQKNKRIIVGYCDSDASVLQQLSLLHGKKIMSIRFARETRDLFVTFAGGLQLCCFVNSISNAQWELRSTDGHRIGVYAGRKIKEQWVEPDRGKQGVLEK